MIILLSPAKTITNTSIVNESLKTIPQYQKEADEIAFQMVQYPVQELRYILKLNPKLAIETYQRFQDFHSKEVPSLQAILAYTGIVFKQINPADFIKEDFIFAQDHLLIVSFCYGLLRPLDLIKPYRMEYNVSLPELGEGNMYDFWYPHLTEYFIDKIAQDDGILLNLGSMDIQPCFNWKKVSKQVRIITPEFKVWKDGKLTTIVIYTKMARGQMSRYVIRNCISDPEDLKLFSWEGFRYNEYLSKEDQWMFIQE